jgi:hypothetical protein
MNLNFYVGSSITGYVDCSVRISIACIPLLFSFFISYAQNAQLILAGNDCRMKASGTDGKMVLCHTDWINNVGVNAFSPGSGTVVFSGSSSDNAVSGSDSTAFGHVWVNKSARDLKLDRNVSVSQVCSLISGSINLQNARLNLSASGSVSGEDNAAGKKIYCPDNSTGHIRAERILSAGSTNTDIAGLGLSLHITAGSAPGNTVILRGHDRQTSTATGFTGIGRYYDIYPSVTSGYTYTFVFRYQDAELAGMPEQNMVFYRSPSHGANQSDWQLTGFGSSVHDAAANTVTLSGLTAFSRWTVSNVSVAPLPIELLSFDAFCGEDQVLLRWTTASEISNASFLVERSGDMQTWEWVGSIPGSGNSNAPLHYTLADDRPLNGTAYYRLTQTDYNGDHETFSPVAVHCESQVTENALSIYPNPVSGDFFIKFADFPSPGSVSVLLSTMQGAMIMRQELTLSAGIKKYPVQVNGLSPGVYALQVVNPKGLTKSLKLIIQ